MTSVDWRSHYKDVRQRLRAAPQHNFVRAQLREPPVPKPIPEPVQEEVHVEAEPETLPPVLAQQFFEAHQLLRAAKISIVPRWKEILRETCAKYKIHPEEVLGKSRESPLIYCRREVYYRLRTELGMSLNQIGLKLNKDHTSVLHGVREYAKALGKQ
jgi:hypothetical protein